MQPLEFERFRRVPLWRRLWEKLSLQRQQSIISCWWAVSLNSFVLFALALLTIALEETQRISITSSMVSPQPEPVMIITTTAPPIEEPQEPEVELPAEPEPPPLPPAVPEVELEPSPSPEASDATEEVPDPTDDSSQDQTSEQRLIDEVESRVQEAGGELEGLVRASLSFTGVDDVDLHIFFEGYERSRAYRGAVEGHLWYAYPQSVYGMLDVDANASFIHPEPCENIVFSSVPKKARFWVVIDHYLQRGPYRPTPYTLVVKNGNRKRVFRGEILPGERMKEIVSFRHQSL